jgi:protoheme IX farnesyltransferase
MAGLLIHRRTDNQQFLEVNGKIFVESSSSAETSEIDDKNGNQKIKGRHMNRARPPVAYASIAPFPFLPAPSYDVV